MLVISVFLCRVCLGFSQKYFSFVFHLVDSYFSFWYKVCVVFHQCCCFPSLSHFFLLLFNVFWEAFFLFLDVFCAFVFLISAVFCTNKVAPQVLVKHLQNNDEHHQA